MERYAGLRRRADHFNDSNNGNASIRIIGTICDITERKQAEQTVQNEIRLREEAYQFAERVERDTANQLRLVVDAAPLLISYVDTELRYRFVNQAYADLFGKSREQIVGSTVVEVIGQAAFEVARHRIEAVFAGEQLTYETIYPYNEGKLSRHVHADMVPDIDETGHVRGYVVVINDITQRKSTEQRERLLAELSGRVRFLADTETILYESARMVGEFTGANRSLFGEIKQGESDAATITIYRDFVQEGVPSLAGMTRPLLSFGRSINEALRAGKVTASERYSPGRMYPAGIPRCVYRIRHSCLYWCPYSSRRAMGITFDVASLRATFLVYRGTRITRRCSRKHSPCRG